MRKTAAYLLLSSLLMLAGGCLHAQEDSTAARKQQRNLAEYQMQHRYRPVNQPFHKGGILANSSLVFINAYYQQFNQNYSNGPYLSLGLDKWLSQWHGVRIGAGYGWFHDNYIAQRLGMLGFRLSYLFNLTGYVDGYNPDRLIEFYPMAGVGFSLFREPGEATRTGLSAHLGLDLNMHILPGLDLVVEPLIEVQKDPRALERMNVWRGYLLAFHGGVGVRLALDKEHYGADPGRNWFVTASGGAQLQNSALERIIRIDKAMGVQTTLGAGRYYSRIFGLRAQVGYGFHFWKEVQDGETDMMGNLLPSGRFRSSYMLLRLEGSMNVLPWIVKKDTPWTAALLLGPEMGYMKKVDPYRADIRYIYTGLTTALQAKREVWNGISAFVEPRLSLVPYSAYAFRTSTVNRNYYDAVFSLSIGVEYNLSNLKKQ